MGYRGKLVSIIILYACHVSVMGARSGPYKSIYTRIEPCPKPSQPVDTDPYKATFYSEVYNSTTEVNLMRGNVSVVKDHYTIKKMKAKSYLWDGGKWKVNYMMNNIGCNRVFFPALAMATGVQYDLKSCSFSKGVYTFNNFSLNKIQHVWMQVQEYGRVLWKVEVFSLAGSVFCYEFETLVEPVQ